MLRNRRCSRSVVIRSAQSVSSCAHGHKENPTDLTQRFKTVQTWSKIRDRRDKPATTQA